MRHFTEVCQICREVVARCHPDCAADDKKISVVLCEGCGGRPNKIAGQKFISEIPPEAGKLVATCVFNDRFMVACEWGLFYLNKDDVLVQVKFKQ